MCSGRVPQTHSATQPQCTQPLTLSNRSDVRLATWANLQALSTNLYGSYGICIDWYQRANSGH